MPMNSCCLLVLLIIMNFQYIKVAMQPFNSQKILLSAFPQLERNLAHLKLGSFPTPIEHMHRLGAFLGFKDLYMKMDGIIGGNKIRKLEFLLAEAQKQKAQTIITFGSYGSNHALTTARCAQQIGMHSVSILKPQPLEDIVIHNFAKIQQISSVYCCLPDQVENTLAQVKKEHSQSYIIPTGGSNPIGIIGFVNAAFELCQQIKNGDLPMPDYLFVPVGSCGTYVGLLLGCKIANLPVKLIGVTVEPEEYANSFEETITRLYKETNRLLYDKDQSFPLIPLKRNDIKLLKEYCGPGYGVFTQEGIEAVELVRQHANIQLDGVYTGKACAGMIDYCQKQNITDEIVLFWNTFCSNSFEKELKSVTINQLPNWWSTYF